MNKMAKVSLNVPNSSQGVHLDLSRKRKRAFYRYIARREKEVKAETTRKLHQDLSRSPVRITKDGIYLKANPKAQIPASQGLLNMEAPAQAPKPTRSLFDIPIPPYLNTDMPK